MSPKQNSSEELPSENEQERLYLEMTRELYLMRKHSLANDGTYMNLSEAISRMMRNNTDKDTGEHIKYKIKDEKKVREIYDRYLPTVFSGLPESFGC